MIATLRCAVSRSGWLLAGLGLVFLAMGCGTAAPLAERAATNTPTATASAPAPSVHPVPPLRPSARAATGMEARLREATSEWFGTPYRYGGTSADGIDCSAFVQTIYRDVLGLSLPRVTADQVQEGAPVPANAHQPGDLVFFRPRGGKSRHVGIYLGAGEFAHAATSQGVTVSHLDEPYWQRSYWTTRRLLPYSAPPASPQTLPSPAPATPAPPAPARAGW